MSMLSKMKEIKIGTALGLAIICLYGALYFAISFYSIDNSLSKFGPGYERLLIKK